MPDITKCNMMIRTQLVSITIMPDNMECKSQRNCAVTQ